ncbi:MAG: SDR family NAD(P)-dependent oxidoreductase, partial [Deltaproteobacteria bacterium]
MSPTNLRPADDALRTALITGACSGIGRAFADRLGSLGYTLIVASNRAEHLEQAAREIRASHGVKVHTVALDLATPDAASTLHDRVGALDVAPDIIVSNAGMFFFGEVADAEPARAIAMLQLHVVTPSLLCTLFGRDLRATSSAVQALVSAGKTDQASDLVAGILAERRPDGSWGTTYNNLWALYALSTYADSAHKSAEGATVIVRLDGREVARTRIGAHTLVERVSVPYAA